MLRRGPDPDFDGRRNRNTKRRDEKKFLKSIVRTEKKKKDSLILIPYASAGALEGGDEGCELLKC